MTKLINFFNQFYHFVRFDIWRMTEYELSRTRRLIYRLIKTIFLAVRGFIVDNLIIRASALTYSILFSMIPLFALIIAIGKGLGVEKMIEASLGDTFIGKAGLTPTVMQFVERYLETTQKGLFIGIGLAILIGSVMNFFMQVEKAFNSIWQVRKSRSPIRQFTTYFSIVLIIPILIVLSSGFSIYVSSALSQTFVFEVFNPLVKIAVKFIPYAINAIVFTIMYMIIPNTRVKFSHALIAGIVAGTAFQVFQMLYINGQVYLSRYNAVYGGFAAIPLLLLWLQISCLIVLLGAEISYVSQNIQFFEYEKDTKDISPRYKNFLTLFISYIIVRQFEDNKPPLSASQIARMHKMPIRLVNQIIGEMSDAGIVMEIAPEKSKFAVYTPGIDINQLSINKLFEKLECMGSEKFLNHKNDELEIFWNKTLDIDFYAKVNGDMLVKDLKINS